MRNIVSPLDGFASPFGRRGLSKYAIGNFDPALVADFDDEYYRANRSKTTFDGLLTHSRLSNATMVDSDGVIKWGPHNLLSRSQEFNVSPWVKGGSTSVSDGADFSTVTLAAGTGPHWVYHGGPSGQVRQGIEAKAGTISWISISSTSPNSDGAYFNLSSGTVGTVKGSDTATITDLGDGWYYCEVVFASDEEFFTLTFANADDAGSSWTASGGETFYIRNARTIRKGLGGMVNNPDRGDSYVPTTSSARYLPRRGHHVYNGSAWVNEGVLIETEARTNVLTYSEAFDNAAWGKANVSVTANSVAGPDGEITADTLTQSVVSSTTVQMAQSQTISAGTVYTYSVFIKQNDCEDFIKILLGSGNQGVGFGVSLDPSDMSVQYANANGTGYVYLSHDVVSVGNGWYRVSVTGSSSTTTAVAAYIAFNDSAIGNHANDRITNGGTGSIFIWGAQLEAASTPSSYIPTSGATVNRTPDILTIPSANLPWPTPAYNTSNLVDDFTLFASTSEETGVSDGTLDFSSGTLTITRNTTEAAAWLNYDTVGTKVYEVSYQVVSGTGVFVLGSAFFANQTTGTYTRYIGNAAGLRFWPQSLSSTLVVDNISVREIDPLSVSIQMDGRATGDTYTTTRWYLDANNYITQEINSSDFTFEQAASGTVDAVTGGSFTSGVNTAFNFASTHASTLVAAAVGGTALTDNTTPVALADLSSTDLQLGYSFMGTLKLMRMWSANITEAGREEAST